MRVPLNVFRKIQDFVYDGIVVEELLPVYEEFVDFSGADFERPELEKLVEAITRVEVEV